MSVAISIHAPPRGATIPFRRENPLAVISIHAPPRGATETVEVSKSGILFQFTPLREGRLNSSAATMSASYFNSRPSARGDVYVWTSLATPVEFQFTPLREGRLYPSHTKGGDGRISIHAPPRGATHNECVNLCFVMTFQFTPLREGRHNECVNLCFVMTFQFTPLREGRLVEAVQRRSPGDFNSRPSARGDGRCRPAQSTTQHFNSRPSARGDDHHRRHAGLNRHFNSRPSARGDVNSSPSSTASTVFQFTPLREGRQKRVVRPQRVSDISIHAPPRGATSRSAGSIQYILISIHAPPRGATNQ